MPEFLDPVPYGYAVRLALSHHLGGRKPCEGLPKCAHCRGLERQRQSVRRRRGEGATERHPTLAGRGRVVGMGLATADGVSAASQAPVDAVAK